MHCTQRWPWTPGVCSAHFCTQQGSCSNPPQVLPCHECHRRWCKESNLPQTCPMCGTIICSACWDSHSMRCHSKEGNYFRRGVRRCQLSSVPFPWIQRLRESMRCRGCTSIVDIAGHSCEVCAQPQCMNETRICETEIRTTLGCYICHSFSGLDVCYQCLPFRISRCAEFIPRLIYENYNIGPTLSLIHI